MSRPLAVHLLKLLEKFNGTSNRSTKLSSVRIAREENKAVNKLPDGTCYRFLGELRTTAIDGHGLRQPVFRAQLYRMNDCQFNRKENKTKGVPYK